MHEELSGVWIMAYTTIDDPSVYFQTTLYTGNSTHNALTNDGNSDLQPDWLWIKYRRCYNTHYTDTHRGLIKDYSQIYTN